MIGLQKPYIYENGAWSGTEIRPWPLQFLIYINDLHETIKYCSVYHLANNASLTTIKNINTDQDRTL